MMPFNERLQGAIRLTWNKPWLKVLDYEYQLQKAHCFPDNRASTVITLSYLRKQFPATSFVWIMGADNLVQFMRWQNAPKIARLVDICVMNRPEFTYKALTSRSIAALGTRVSTYNLGSSPKRKWAYSFSTRNTLSATKIRQNKADE
jgi:nicotinate-nucleotide adenylyltransferase